MTQLLRGMRLQIVLLALLANAAWLFCGGCKWAAAERERRILHIQQEADRIECDRQALPESKKIEPPVLLWVTTNGASSHLRWPWNLPPAASILPKRLDDSL